MDNFQITVKTLEGLEEVLAGEITALGGTDIVCGQRAVHFTGDLAMIYRSNYRLRTALRIFRQIGSFRFTSMEEFYIRSLKIKWEQWMNLQDTFIVQSTVVNSELFKNSMFASLKLKDAIADRFRQKTGSRPSVDTAEPDIIFHVHISGDQCSLSIDSSGESLHKRGYRQSQGDAPLNEVLAAGMILHTGWNGNSDFLDPMCGSGTLPIEAAMIARNIPPGKFRKNYAFMNWKDYDSEIFEKIKEEIVPLAFNYKIYAADLIARNIISAQTNARNARVFNLIEFLTCDFKELSLELNNAIIIINPPYGDRIRMDQPEELYSMIGERLKHHFSGNNAWILSSSLELINKIGLKTSQKKKLFNGAIECTFNKYDLFEGKRKLVLIRKLS